MITTTITPEIIVSCLVKPTTSPAPSEMRKRRRAVSFSTTELIRPTLRRTDFTKTELKQTWYTVEELMEIRRYNQVLVVQHAMDNCEEEGLGEDGEDCFRGLEKKTRAGSMKKGKTRQHARTAVLKSQRKQKKKYNRVNVEKLAEKYRKCTKEASEEAQAFGIKDANVAAVLKANMLQVTKELVELASSSSQFRRSSHPMSDSDISRLFTSLYMTPTRMLFSI